jgi:RNA polymerase sigma factor (sigma-70 family)
MIGGKLQVLLRKLLRKKHLKTGRCPMQRWTVRPCLDALELRTLPSAAWTPPTMPPGAAAAYVANLNAAQPDAVQAKVSTTNTDAAAAMTLDGPGFDVLLQDLGEEASVVHSAPLAAVPPATYAASLTTSTSVAVLPERPHTVTAVTANEDVGHALNPEPIAGPVSRLSAAAPAHAAATVASTAIVGFSPVAAPTTDAAVDRLPAAKPFLPESTGPSAGLADGWVQPLAPAGRDASSVLPALQTPFVAWANPDEGAIPAQAPAAATPAVAAWDFADGGPAPAAPTAAVWEFAESESAPAVPTVVSTDLAASYPGVESLAAVPTDGALLQRFVIQRDQAAFTTLVARYERLVFSICQRVLVDAQAAEDAVQATFLVLARKAGALDPQRPLLGWLYLVAYHLALRLRSIAARRRRCEMQAARSRPSHEDDEGAADLESQEIYHVLREELQRLPEKTRVPLILCYFQGRTHAEAAEAIGMPRGSIAKRIGEGLEQLRQRLADRGIAS